MKEDCRVCGGEGWLRSEPSPNTCSYCKGTGRTERHTEVNPSRGQIGHARAPERNDLTVGQG